MLKDKVHRGLSSAWVVRNLQERSWIENASIKQAIWKHGKWRPQRLFASMAEKQEEQRLSGMSVRKKLHSASLTPENVKQNYELHLRMEALDRPELTNFEADIGTYASLLRNCSDAEALLDGKHVHYQIINRGFEQHLLLGNLLVQMYSNCGALEYAHDVFKKLSCRDVFACNFMMRAYAQHGFGKEALRVFEQMQQEGVVPSKFVFISFFCSCGSLEALIEGRRMHACIIGTEFKSDIALNTSLINMYGKCGSPEYATTVFNKMPEQDAVSFNSLLSVYLQHGQGKDALQIFHSMQQQGVSPTKVTFICTFDACAAQVGLTEGKQIHSCMMGSEFEADIMVSTALINMYGKCGSVDSAERVFDKMIFRDGVLWSAMIAVCAQNGHINRTLQLFKQMQEEGMLPMKFIFSSILSGCASQMVPTEGKQVHARIMCNGAELDIVVGNAVVNLYGKLGCVEAARNAFDKMLEQDLVSWNALIAAYAQQEQVEGALQAFDQMQQAGLMADKVTFVSILSACTSHPALTQGKVMHVYIIGSNLISDVTVANALLNMYGKCSHLEYLHELFREMPEQNLVSWNTLIAAHAQNGNDKEALQLFDQMQGEGVIPDKLTFTSVLSVCANHGDLAEGKQLHDYFMTTGFGLDFIMGSALVSLYGKCGSLIEARKIFDKMPEHDTVVWNAVIAACALSGQGKDALELFNQMQLGGVKPTCVTFISVLFACSHAGLLNDGYHYFNSMKKNYDIIPAVDHCNCLVDLLGRAGLLDEAEELLNNMLNYTSVEPTTASWMTLLGACRSQFDVERGKRTAKKVLELDPKNASPYVMLWNIYAGDGRGDDAGKLAKEMKNGHESQTPECGTSDRIENINELTDEPMYIEEELYGLYCQGI